MNAGFGPNPALFNIAPYSTLGAGFLLLPTDSVVFNFGIGFYYTNFSNHLPEIVLSGDEIGLEVFYNIAATNCSL